MGFFELPQEARNTAHSSAAAAKRSMASMCSGYRESRAERGVCYPQILWPAKMSFQIRPLKEFLVKPALPPALSRLPELGLNLMWSWHHAQRAVFRRLDPAIWKASNHNPVVMLGRVPQETLERAARDPRYLALVPPRLRNAGRLHGRARTRPPRTCWWPTFRWNTACSIACPSIPAVWACFPGDHLKASSDAILPLVGLGLLYQRGYFRQSLDPDGWQQERTPVNDFYSLPITPVTRADGSELIVDVLAGETTVFLKVWRIDLGRVRLYLMDSNIPQNADPFHRDITGQLYAGDHHKRICQEIVLGIGGLRVLKELGLATHRLSHERRPLGVSGRGANPPADGGAAVEPRRGPGGVAHQQRLHHPYPRAGRHRPVRHRPDAPVLRTVLPRSRESASTSSWPWDAAIRRMGRSRFPWPSRPSRPPRTATRSAACTGPSRSRCGKACGRNSRCGKFPLPPSPTASICRPGSTAISPRSTISTCSRIGAKATPSRKSGSRSPKFPTRNCGRRTAAESAAWWRSCGKAWWPARWPAMRRRRKSSACRTCSIRKR